MKAAYPLSLAPQWFPRIWGGYALPQAESSDHGIAPAPQATPIGEAWDVHDGATVRNGICAGQTLAELLQQDAAALLGADAASHAGFPLLIKRLFVGDWLSLQVHPNDAQAARFENEPRGKEEAWLVLAPAEQDAEIILGLQPGATVADVEAALAEPARWERILRRVPVRAGAILHIPPGTVHAIGPGVTLYEVQQNSDITYRLYDWGRMGLEGRPRALHPAKALAVTCTEHRPQPRYLMGDQVLLFETAHFRTERRRIRDVSVLNTEGRRCHALTVIEGALQVLSQAGALPLSAGESALIPAVLGAYELRGEGTVLRTEPA